MLHNSFPFTPTKMNLQINTLQGLRMCAIDFGVNDQGHNALITENGNRRIIAFPLHLSS